MTDDIVYRLREETCHMPECCWLFTDAADEIERLRKNHKNLMNVIQHYWAHESATIADL
jgi:hypothetical protein